MSTLLARTRIEFYRDIADRARKEGIADDVISKVIMEEIRIARSLITAKCPKCGAPALKYIDRQSQQGPSSIPGVWVMWRCSTQPPPGKPRTDGMCDFMVDMKEGAEAN